MKKLLLFLAFAVCAAQAQVSNPAMIIVTTAPAGSCTNGPARFVITTGHIYACQAGTWTDITGGATTSGFPFTLGATSIASSSTNPAITGLTIDGVTPTTMAFVDATSSIQTQLNGKAASNASTQVNGQACALSGSCTVTAAPSGTAGGVLSGTYPNPGLSASATAIPNGWTATTQSQLDGSTKLATNAYVDLAVSNAVAGVNPAVAVLAASTASLTGTYVQVGGGVGDTFTVTATGAFTLDGIAINAIGQRVLLKNQSTASQNGVYFATVVGAVAVSPVFTRALDYDTPSDVNNTGSIPVQSGTANSTTSWLLTSQVTSIGSAGSALTYAQFTVAPIANTTFTTSTSTVNANTCSGSSTVTITGVASTSVFSITPNADTSAITGWGSSGGLVIDAWPTANTLNYKICNQTTANITPGAVTFNVGAR